MDNGIIIFLLTYIAILLSGIAFIISKKDK